MILSAIKPRHGKVTCIPNTSEKYTSFSIGNVTFIDSCQFMQSSLDKLVSNLDEYPETRKFIEHKITNVVDDDELVNIIADLPTDLDDFADDGDADVYNIENVTDYREHPFEASVLTDEQKVQCQREMSLMTRKGVYPYEYFDCWEKFGERELPAKDTFYI